MTPAPPRGDGPDGTRTTYPIGHTPGPSHLAENLYANPSMPPRNASLTEGFSSEQMAQYWWQRQGRWVVGGTLACVDVGGGDFGLLEYAGVGTQYAGVDIEISVAHLPGNFGGVYAFMDAGGNGYAAVMDGDGAVYLWRMDAYVPTQLATAMAAMAGHKLRLRCLPTQQRVYRDGVQIMAAADATYIY